MPTESDLILTIELFAVTTDLSLELTSIGMIMR
jgi:hypothetical protein